MATTTEGGGRAGPPFDDFYEAMEGMGEDFDRFLKFWAIDQREFRNVNQAAEKELARERLAAQKAWQDFQQLMSGERLKVQQENYERTGEERRLRREGSQQRTAADQAYRAQQAQYRRERDTTNMAYRQQRDAERDARRQAAGRTQQSYSAPSFSRPGTGIGSQTGGWAPDRAQVAKFIIFVTALAAITAAANDIVNNAPAAQLPDGTKIPAHLRSVGGAFIAGTVALIVNEVYPALGALLGTGILAIVVVPNLTVSPAPGRPSLLGRIGNAFGSAPVKTSAATTIAPPVQRGYFGNPVNPVTTA